MTFFIDEDLLQEARIYYQKRNFKMLEPLLQQLLMSVPSDVKGELRWTEVYQMQANLYLNKGQFTKAIRSFKQALQIDPRCIDASIGLSVLLNDLGKYEEARKVYEDAEKLRAEQQEVMDPQAQEKLAVKHEELADLYLQTRKFNEALEQLKLALNLSNRKAEITLRIADLYSRAGHESQAIKELKQLILEHPHFVAAKIKLGLLLYGQNKISEAVAQWESVLLRDPQNIEAQRYLRKAQSILDGVEL